MNDTNPSTDDRLKVNHMKFVLLTTCSIPSTIICLYIFLFFLNHRNLLVNYQNQSLFLLIIINFIQLTCDLPMSIDFYRMNYVYPSKPSYCTWWTYFEYSLSAINEFLMATISIQRHLLIFHRNQLGIRWKRNVYYKIPLFVCLIYPTILYLILVVIYPCDGSQWDYSSHLCGAANCYLLYNQILSTIDWIVDSAFPILIIIIANICLIIRVVHQKRRRFQTVTWRKQRRMTLQLLYISSLYIIAWSPSIIIGIVQQLGSPDFLMYFQSNYSLDLIYLVCLFLPWLCFGLIPDLTKSMKTRLFCQHNARNLIRPTPFRLTQS